MKNSDHQETLFPAYEEIRKIGLRLLLDKKLKLADLNEALRQIPLAQLQRRIFLQTLLQQKKIQINEFLLFEKPEWTHVQDEVSLYQLRLKNGFAEFYQVEQNNPKFCPKCRVEFADDKNFCPVDGTSLVSVHTEESADPLLNLIIDDRYQLLQLLGKGGMGSVYKARHIKLEKIVAVKILQPQLMESKTLLTRFLREAQAASRLNHPHIIHIYDYGEVKSSVFYIAMEHIEGTSLKEYLDWRGSVPVEEASYLMLQCLDALGAAHEKQMVHRDIKPANMMLVSHPKKELFIKILDFGTAKLLDDQVDITSSVIGTPQYMSPEQAKGEGIDGRSDLYSLGIMFYEMLTGERPFHADTVHGYLGKHITELPVPLRLRCPEKNFSATLEAVVDKALAKDPQQRYQTAKEFSQTLSKAVKIPSVFYLDLNILKTPKISTNAPPRRLKKTFFRMVLSLFFLILIAGISFVFLPPESQKKIRSFFVATIIPTPSVEVVDIFDEKVSKFSEQFNIKLREIRTRNKQNPPKVLLEEMVLIPAGTYYIGSNQTSDNPNKTQIVSEFYMDKYEVTNQQYFLFVQETGHTPPSYWVKDEKGQISYKKEEAFFPVTHVNWFDCSLYACWAGKRLPSEAEYEIASAGKFSYLYPWGHQNHLGYANTRNTQGVPSHLSLAQSFPKDVSEFGVCQLAGNVREWMADWYDPKWQRERSTRGSSFKEDIMFGSSHFRDAFHPCYSAVDLGFRCVWDKNSAE